MAALAACGGGGDSPAVPPAGADAGTAPVAPPVAAACNPPEGVQPATDRPFAAGGTIAGRADPSFIALSVPYGMPYRRIVVYGPDLAASSIATGFIDAGSELWCQQTNAYNGWDYGSGGSLAELYLRTAVDAATSTLSGSVRYASTTYAMSGTSLPGAAAGYRFDRPADLAQVAGAWQVNAFAGGSLVVTIDANGGVTRSDGSGGSFDAGALRPSATGVNLFDYSAGVGGVGLVYPLAGGGWQLLLFWYEAGPMEDVPRLAIGRR